MASYRLVFKKSVAKDLRPVPEKALKRLLVRIESLSHNPRPPGVEKLSGQERYRTRQGVYRIVYEIRDGELVVIVVRVGHRKAIYRQP